MTNYYFRSGYWYYLIDNTILYFRNSAFVIRNSIADFIHKLKIALKEARETKYWLKLLIATEEKLENRLLPLLNESNELIAILVTIVKNTKINS
jgi:hypothetical protein